MPLPAAREALLDYLLAKEMHRKLQGTAARNPTLGEVRFTRVGWMRCARPAPTLTNGRWSRRCRK
ncbi:hypothetical protein DF3PB_830011 [uncultured Defluviicoccus sp.]|uniref:Uncharacterized protein n=1 Tax=metagenome TaxID=256318 RepID=A0A380TJU2_9ZZZZ|nr:hypothetical protein DF3PB_830011 [uncultured Defluviicoccus sp.]